MKVTELHKPVKSWFIFQGIVGIAFLLLAVLPIKNMDAWGRTGSAVAGSSLIINSMLILGKGH